MDALGYWQLLNEAAAGSQLLTRAAQGTPESDRAQCLDEDGRGDGWGEQAAGGAAAQAARGDQRLEDDQRRAITGNPRPPRNSCSATSRPLPSSCG